MLGLVSLFSILSMACGSGVAGVEDEDRLLPDLIGDWAWKCSVGGIGGQQICAETSGLSQTWSFGTDSIFQAFRNDTLLLTAPFDVRREGPGIFGDSINVLYLGGTPTILALGMPSDSVLLVQEQAYDGFGSTFVRIR